MISKFKNKFKKSDLDEKIFFCQKVIEILTENFPNKKFILDEQGEAIKVEELKLGLTNLRSKFLKTSQTDFELKEMVSEHFNSLSDVFEKDEEILTLDSVKDLVLPQLMPLEFINRMPIINFPFGDEVSIGIVIDSENSYQYIIEENLQTWEVSKEEIYSRAIENLMDKSNSLEMTFVPPPNGIIVVNSMDSFDAVRILAPQMQEFFAEKLDNKFYFGIPNRGFLICWSQQGDDDFQQAMKHQLVADFEEQPYPLSKSVFEFDLEEGISQISVSDNRMENWMTNN